MPSTAAAREAIAAALRLFIDPADVTELRVLPFPGGAVTSGFYDGNHLDAMAHEASYHSGSSAGVYFIPTPLKSTVLERRPNKSSSGKPKKGGMASDADVVRRKWLMIDVDPTRAAGHDKESASVAEKVAAFALSDKVRELLNGAGWLPPLAVDSGNGVHLYYRLPTDDPRTGEVPALLTALSVVFGDPAHGAKIDTTIGNPARIMKLPGTRACKGTHSQERPHRLANIHGEVPATWKDHPAIPAGHDSLIGRTLAMCEAARPGSTAPATSHAPAHTIRLPARMSNPGTSRYGAAALLRECQTIANAASGTRNHTLFAAACAIFELIAGGEIDQREAESAVLDAARACGLDDGETAVTVNKAVRHVAGNPRQATGAGVIEAPPIPGLDGAAVTTKTVVPAVAAARPTGPAQLRNYRIQTNERGEQSEVGRPLGEIAQEVLAKAGGWPKRNGGVLFIQQQRPDGEFDVRFLENSVQLFVWLASIYESQSSGTPGVEWAMGTGKYSRDELYQELLNVAAAYDTIELCPHYPPVASAWYCHRPVPEPTGRDLSEFVNMFTPASPGDAELIRAAILTLFWGGEAGLRPGFLVTTNDGGDGRGYGKTTFVHLISRLTGGAVSVNPNGKRELVTVLLSPGAITKRVALVDNLKSLHFSSSEIEALFTAPTIDGNKLYDGYGSRPNYLCWFLTVNSANMSQDMAERTVPIHMGKPKYSPDWLGKVGEFIARRRWHIIADCLAELRSEPAGGIDWTRKGTWEGAVLSRMAGAVELSKLIAERQAKTNGDKDDVGEIEGALWAAIKGKGFDPEKDHVWIDTKSLTEIVKPYASQTSVIGIMRWLFCLPLKRLTRSKNNAKRGGVWNYSSGVAAMRFDSPGLSAFD